ncbi:major facilitator super transporter protein, partial [Podila epigama]
MRPWILYCFLVASSLCQLVGLVMFAKGFFPYKSISTTFASMDDLPAVPYQDSSSETQDRAPIRPRYGKLVVMLVDALRSLINNNQALPFTAIASAPTVTLPRLKALTTGTVPSFLDAILNIAESDQSSTLAHQDNWIAQFGRSKSLRKKRQDSNRKIGFFGDDTWVKLFPGQFFRSDGTSSFFAMDTVEVDNNVTRHVLPELVKDDWDALIFHYLGLDHVGHSGGPKSALMHPKQAEMDTIVKTIYDTLADQHQQDDLPTLFLLCGDHGMNEVGNHGGSSRSEISTAFLFMSPHFQEDKMTTRISAMFNPYRAKATEETEEYQYYKSVNQVDLVPTISLLLGLPIPINSVGKLIPELFDDYSDIEKLRALQINAYQVAKVLRAKWSDFEPEASIVLQAYKTMDDNAEDQDSDEAAFQACAGLDSEKLRLGCWYTEALAAHTSFLEMQKSSSGISYKSNDKNARFRAAEKSYSKFLDEASSMLSTALSKYDMPLLSNGSLMMAFAVAGFIFCALQTRLFSDFKKSCWEPSTTNTTFASKDKASRAIVYTSPDVAPLPSLAHVAVPTPLVRSSTSTFTTGMVNDINWTMVRGLSIVIFVLYLVTLFASSFVEEEHQFWYFFHMTWWATLGITSARYVVPRSTLPDDKRARLDVKPYLAAGYCFAQMAILRLLRSWNQTGQKYADQIDLRHYLNSTWTGFSIVLFVVAMVVIALTMISLVYGFQREMGRNQQDLTSAPSETMLPSPSSPSPGWQPVVSMLQALLVVLIVLVTSWISLYKLDLESAYLGDAIMSRIHSIMFSLSAVGYSHIAALPLEQRSPLAVSGFELARGCYLGLGLILVLTLSLKVLSSTLVPLPESNSASDSLSDAAFVDKNAASKVLKDKAQTLFVPSMLLGTATLLLVLLSRRHNAPIFILFGLQLWMYLEWISLIRQHPLDPVRHGVNTRLDDTPTLRSKIANVYVVESSDQDTEGVNVGGASPTKSLALVDLAFRTLPGQSSIHSCTALLWILSSFFLLGNSNSIASIDISNAYVGIQSYDIFLTGVLTFVSNWAGPIWWSLATVTMMCWDLEWEFAWSQQMSMLERVRAEEQAWTTVHGWKQSKEDKRAGTSRKMRRKIARERKLKAIVKEQRSTVVAPQEHTLPLSVQHGPESPIGHAEQADNQGQTKSYSEHIHDESEHLQAEEDSEIEYLEETGMTEDDNNSTPILNAFASKGKDGYRLHLAQLRIVEHLILTSIFFGVTLYALSIAAIILRHHLFIWTVFSPK